MAPSEPGARRSSKVVAVLGPTGSGKSAFAVELAGSVGGEILSCDSMAVYRGIDIATDKVPPEARCGIPHHLYDVAEAGSYFSAGLFRKLAVSVIESVVGRGRVPIVVGGTGLYARALLSGIAEAPSRDEGLRERLNGMISMNGPEKAHRLLSRLDPERAAQVAPKDGVRIVRALELRLLTGKKFSDVMKEGAPAGPGFEFYRLCVSYPREELYRRIEKRVDEMVAKGLVEEAKNLFESGRMTGPAAKAIGYKELVPCFETGRDMAGAVDEIKKNTRNLAKRQITWFRKEIALKWVMMDEAGAGEKAIAEVRAWVKGESHGR